MTLLEYMNNHEGEEIAVHDVDYDMESYFYGGEPQDDWDRAIQKLAACLDVKEIEKDAASPVYVAGVTVNLSEVIEKNLDNIKDLFIVPTVDAIMYDMPAILSGNVSEKWIVNFADALSSDLQKIPNEKSDSAMMNNTLPEIPNEALKKTRYPSDKLEYCEMIGKDNTIPAMVIFSKGLGARQCYVGVPYDLTSNCSYSPLSIIDNDKMPQSVIAVDLGRSEGISDISDEATGSDTKAYSWLYYDHAHVGDTFDEYGIRCHYPDEADKIIDIMEANAVHSEYERVSTLDSCIAELKTIAAVIEQEKDKLSGKIIENDEPDR